MKKYFYYCSLQIIILIIFSGCSGYIDSKKAEEAYAQGNYDEAQKLVIVNFIVDVITLELCMILVKGCNEINNNL